MSEDMFVATTDENGRATFDDLPPGEYTLARIDLPPGHNSVEVIEK